MWSSPSWPEPRPSERSGCCSPPRSERVARPQGIGLLPFFALWLISGTAPSRSPAGLRAVGGVLPLSQLGTAVQNPWFRRDWSAADLAVLITYAVTAGVPALWLLRWD